jgi:hypothetical protein
MCGVLCIHSPQPLWRRPTIMCHAGFMRRLPHVVVQSVEFEIARFISLRDMMVALVDTDQSFVRGISTPRRAISRSMSAVFRERPADKFRCHLIPPPWN